MAEFINQLRNRFSLASVPMRFIYINIAVFVVVRVLSLIFTLCGLDATIFVDYLSMPSNTMKLIMQPWTLITYMFLHCDILHILFNMLWFYWFGALFMEFFNARQFTGMYFLGGLGGALLYLAAYNLLPFFAGTSGMLLGASASIIAIVAATAMRAPDYKINLLFIGAVSLKWIAIITIFIDLISIDTANAGGHIAHLGGAATGALFGYMIRRGKDITAPFNAVIDFFVNLFRRKPSIKIGDNRRQNHKKKYWYQKPVNDDNGQSHYTPKQEPKMDPADEAQLDAILAKIKQSGYKSLTAEEKRKLFEVSRK